jgi:gliding motility-associated-like protein
LTITIISKTTPTFTPISPVCEGTILAALPAKSNDNITGSWSPALNNIATTEYTFTPDINQCANSAKITINVNPKPIPLLADGMICIDKNTNAIIQSYVLDTKLNSVDYNFEWFLNGNAIINAIGNTLEAVEKGIYSVIATNKNTNCSSAPIEATITETFSDSTVVEIEQTNSFNNAATITISIIQGIGNYEFQLDNGIFQTSTVFSEVAAGTHIINIIDVNGCTNLSKEIVVLGYPKFFTPNGDGNNDTWNIIGFTTQSNPIITIFDRYGKLLKQMSSDGLGWDGTFNGLPLPSSDYWFDVKFIEDGILKEFKSHFSLKR